VTATAAPPVPRAARRRLTPELPAQAAWTWALTLSVVLYLGIAGGGFDLVVRSRAGVVIWWVLLAGAALGLLPFARLGRAGRVTLILLAGFTAWTTASTLWSLSSERSLDEASRLAMYLGIAVLATTTAGDRDRALRHTIGALCASIVIIAGLALLARLRPGLFPGSAATAAALPHARARLSWPLNYWNALGAFVAFGVPLLLAMATSARRHVARAVAAGSVPMLVLCGYLTFSRTSAVAAAIAVAVLLALSPRRIPRVASALVCAAGGGVLVLATVHRHAIENGQTSGGASSQGGSLLVLVIVVCLAVGLAQFGLARAWDRIPRLGRLTVPVRPATAALVVAVIAVLIAAVALGAPHRLDHAYQSFKNANGAHVHSDTIDRFTTLSGNGRYTYWKTALQAMPGHWLDGFGAGTFQFVWLPRAPLYAYIVNAHSIFVETLTELGIVGLLLLVGFLASVLLVAARSIRGAEPTTRALLAAALASSVAFVVSCGFDWIWQVPVVPAAFLLLAAAVVAPASPTSPHTERSDPERPHPARPLARGLAARGVAVLAAIACLGLIGTPMAMTQAVQRSQSDANAGKTAAAVSQSVTASNIEPGAASPDIQTALVLELEGRYAQAVAFTRRATANEPQNWNAWLIRSRLEAEAGNARQAVRAYIRAHQLNRRSPLFRD
jgi:hypothetical protein